MPRSRLLRNSLSGDDVALVVNQGANHEDHKTSSLKQAVLAETFSEPSRGEVEQVAVHHPYKQSAQGLEDGAEHCAQVVCDAHAREVVHQHGKHLPNNDEVHHGGGLDELDGVKGVLLLASNVASGEEVHRRQHHRAHQNHAVEPLKADHLQGRHVEIGKEVVLKRQLDRLHHLRKHHQAHAVQHRASVLTLLAARSAQQ
mmetsp:Transcript_48157/g.92054  ORF Transcript_48157/g.92054 Transcript_48157/m.92054 type:complete len:200 (+) Transcript_48157:490-1089(+)